MPYTEYRTELRPMFKIAKEYFKDKPVVGVEVGTSAGKNAIEVLRMWKEVTRLDCIDPYLTYQGYIDFILDSDQTLLRNCCVQEFVIQPKAHLMIDLSVEAAKKFADESLDFVYIDANHSYKYVKEDILAWLPKIKKGGIIGGHDWDWSDPDNDMEMGVKRAVEEIFGEAKEGSRVNYHIKVYVVDDVPVSKDKDFAARLDSDWWVFK